MKFLVVLSLFALAAAEPEADPAVVYTNYGYHYPSYYNYPVARYASTYSPYVYSTPYHYLFKREAEAEAEPNHHFFNGYSFPYTYYNTPYAFNYAAPVKVEYKAPEMPEMKMDEKAMEKKAVVYANPYVYTHPVAYHAPVAYHTPVTYQVPVVPRYHAKSAEGVEHKVYKREAEAEADPFTVYNYGFPYAYNNYAYGAYYRPYTTYSGYYPYSYYY